MSRLTSFLDGLDHPLLFVFFVTLAVLGVRGFMLWGADKAGFPGLKSAVQ